MKIVFLCGCLEPGHDGVGDYVRRLAVELLGQGHETAGVALNDHHTDHEMLHGQPFGEVAFQVLRLPAGWPATRRFRRARHWIDDFGAEWLSLQFVPFSFHPKGLSFQLSKHLAVLGAGRQWHLMVHELWVGMEQEAPSKHVWWGKLQRHLIKSLITSIKPRVIHTQTQLYQRQLTKLGFQSSHLPLFSNIPNQQAAPAAANVSSGLPIQPKVAKPDIALVMFGGIQPGAPVEQLARDAASYAQAHGIRVTLTIVGRSGKEQEHWAASWTAVGLPLDIRGEQSPAAISEILRSASIGLSTTPAAQIEKSGTVAAMQEHGLPVLCVARAWSPRGITGLQLPSGISLYTEGMLAHYFATTQARPMVNRISAVAQRFLQALSTQS